MKTKINYWLLSFHIILPTLLTGCEKKEDKHYLFVNPSLIEIPGIGGSDTIRIETNASLWKIISKIPSWITLSKTYGKGPQDIVIVTVSSQSKEAKKDTIVFSAEDAQPVNVIVTQSKDQWDKNLTVNPTQFNVLNTEDSVSLTIETDANQWSITTNDAWIKFNVDKGSKGKTLVKIYISDNPLTTNRSGKIVIQGDSVPSVVVTIIQQASIYPTYNATPLPPDTTGMKSNAQDIAKKIKVGWNIGNTLEAIGSETAWGNPKISKALIEFVKANGFNAIRIPCSWNQYVIDNETAQINPEWLDRVKEVVQYCVDEEMYVILNIHWDGGWLENNCTVQKKEENNAKQKAFWEQIATHLRDFDEHVLFASANEPNVDNSEQMNVLLSYHQTFINAVRSTGGKNYYRVLVIQGPSTDIEKTYNLMNQLPKDKVSNRMMVEIHYYTPWNFCGLEKDESWGKMFYYWGKGYHSTTDPEHNATWGEEETVDKLFKLMKTKFIEKGIPVVLGEYAPTRRSNLTGEALELHLASRAYYIKYVTQQARANGILPFYWDNGGLGAFACGIFDRHNLKVFDTQALTAIMDGTNSK